jgi:hypothetical protein
MQETKKIHDCKHNSFEVDWPCLLHGSIEATLIRIIHKPFYSKAMVGLMSDE